MTFSASAGPISFIVIDGVQEVTGTAQLNYRLVALSQLQATLLNQQVRLRLVGPASRSFTIESSTNLVSWIPLLTTNAPTGVINWVGPRAATSLRQFYRGFQIQ